MREKGILKISGENDRTLVATVLFKNGYSVTPVRKKKNGRAYEYYIQYEGAFPDGEEINDS